MCRGMCRATNSCSTVFEFGELWLAQFYHPGFALLPNMYREATVINAVPEGFP
jgi:hypothetical protein